MRASRVQEGLVVRPARSARPTHFIPTRRSPTRVLHHVSVLRQTISFHDATLLSPRTVRGPFGPGLYPWQKVLNVAKPRSRENGFHRRLRD
jgi:hypothetical protein